MQVTLLSLCHATQGRRGMRRSMRVESLGWMWEVWGGKRVHGGRVGIKVHDWWAAGRESDEWRGEAASSPSGEALSCITKSHLSVSLSVCLVPSWNVFSWPPVPQSLVRPLLTCCSHVLAASPCVLTTMDFQCWTRHEARFLVYLYLGWFCMYFVSFLSF